MVALFEIGEKQVSDEKWLDYKFYASMQGHDLDKAIRDKQEKTGERKLTKEELFEEAARSPFPVFRDPDYYDHLTQEEREQLTQIMMGKHVYWRDKKAAQKQPRK